VVYIQFSSTWFIFNLVQRGLYLCKSVYNSHLVSTTGTSG